MNQTQRSLVLMDMGMASKVIRGNPFLWPFFEVSAPPFDHYDPFE